MTYDLESDLTLRLRLANFLNLFGKIPFRYSCDASYKATPCVPEILTLVRWQHFWDLSNNQIKVQIQWYYVNYSHQKKTFL